jgi:hypothetical protein
MQYIELAEHVGIKKQNIRGAKLAPLILFYIKWSNSSLSDLSTLLSF